LGELVNTFIPVIAREAFGDFHEMLAGSLPDDYGDWLDRVETWRVAAAASRSETVNVSVSAEELRAYLAETGRPPGLEVLRDLAEHLFKAMPAEESALP